MTTIGVYGANQCCFFLSGCLWEGITLPVRHHQSMTEHQRIKDETKRNELCMEKQKRKKENEQRCLVEDKTNLDFTSFSSSCDSDGDDI